LETQAIKKTYTPQTNHHS